MLSMANPEKNKRSTLKTLLIVLGAGVGILAVVLFLGSRSGSTEAPSTGLVTESAGGQVASGSLADTDSTARRSDELVRLLNSVSSIRLDDSIFRNPAFNALRDINSTLPSDRNPGRDNPFLPIGQDPVSSGSTVFRSSTTTVQADTNNTGSTTADETVSTGDAALQGFVNTDTAAPAE